MLERVLIVPDKDNAGVSLAKERAEIERTLLRVAGGFTSERVSGAWLDDAGKLYRDKSTRYTVAVSDEQDAAIAGWLPVWVVSLRQAALFTSTRQVSVEFVTAAVA